jgi:hypothetical protein
MVLKLVLYSFSPVRLAADMPSVLPSSDMVPLEQSCQSCGVHDNVQCIGPWETVVRDIH